MKIGDDIKSNIHNDEFNKNLSLLNSISINKNSSKLKIKNETNESKTDLVNNSGINNTSSFKYEFLKINNENHVLFDDTFVKSLLVRNLGNSKFYSLNEIQIETNENINIDQDLLKIQKLIRIKNKNVVKMEELFIENNRKLESNSDQNIISIKYFLEHSINGNLYQKLIINEFFDEAVCCKYFIQILKAVEFLYNQNIIEYELELKMIEIDKNDNIKLNPYHSYLKKLKEKDYLIKESMSLLLFRLGLTLFEMSNNYNPFEVFASTFFKNYDNLSMKKLMDNEDEMLDIFVDSLIFNENLSLEIRNLIQRLLTNKIKLNEVSFHSWIIDYSNKCIIRKNEIVSTMIRRSSNYSEIDAIHNDNTDFINKGKIISTRFYLSDLDMSASFTQSSDIDSNRSNNEKINYNRASIFTGINIRRNESNSNFNNSFENNNISLDIISDNEIISRETKVKKRKTKISKLASIISCSSNIRSSVSEFKYKKLSLLNNKPVIKNNTSNSFYHIKNDIENSFDNKLENVIEEEDIENLITEVPVNIFINPNHDNLIDHNIKDDSQCLLKSQNELDNFIELNNKDFEKQNDIIKNNDINSVTIQEVDEEELPRIRNSTNRRPQFIMKEKDISFMENNVTAILTTDVERVTNIDKTKMKYKEINLLNSFKKNSRININDLVNKVNNDISDALNYDSNSKKEENNKDKFNKTFLKSNLKNKNQFVNTPKNIVEEIKFISDFEINTVENPNLKNDVKYSSFNNKDSDEIIIYNSNANSGSLSNKLAIKTPESLSFNTKSSSNLTNELESMTKEAYILKRIDKLKLKKIDVHEDEDNDLLYVEENYNTIECRPKKKDNSSKNTKSSFWADLFSVFQCNNVNK